MMTRKIAVLCWLLPALGLRAADLVVDADATTRTTLPAQNSGALPQLQVDATSKSYIRFNLTPARQDPAPQAQ